jgi:hypothetical protein
MTQEDLDLAISRATGESLRTIRRFGFSSLDPLHQVDADDGDQEPHIVDWDSIDHERVALAVVA